MTCGWPGCPYTYGEGMAAPAIAEPPNFDYNQSIKESVPPDMLLKILHQNDPVTRTKVRDLIGEEKLLLLYRNWAADERQYDLEEAVRRRLRSGSERAKHGASASWSRDAK